MHYLWNKLKDRTFVLAASLTIVSVLISVVSYTKIILKLRQHQAQVQDVQQGQPNEEISRQARRDGT